MRYIENQLVTIVYANGQHVLCRVVWCTKSTMKVKSDTENKHYLLSKKDGIWFTRGGGVVRV